MSFLRQKSHVFEYFKQFRSMIEKQTGKFIKTLRLDQGGEFKKGDFIKYYKKHGIHHQFTTPYTPQQNGVVERKNRTLMECAHSVLKGKNLSNGFWAKALNTAMYFKNRSPTKCMDYKTPFEAVFGFKPTISHLRVFGCKAFSHVPKEDKKKLDSKAIKCTLLDIVGSLRLISCLILLLLRCLQAEMWYSTNK